LIYSTSTVPSLTLTQSCLKAGPIHALLQIFSHLMTAQGTHSSSYIGQSLAVRHSGMMITQGHLFFTDRAFSEPVVALSLVPWLSGRTSVFDRRAFAVLRLTSSWRVTT